MILGGTYKMWNDCDNCNDKDSKIKELDDQVYDLERNVRDLEADNEILEREKEDWRREYHEVVEYDKERIGELEDTIRHLEGKEKKKQ